MFSPCKYVSLRAENGGHKTSSSWVSFFHFLCWRTSSEHLKEEKEALKLDLFPSGGWMKHQLEFSGKFVVWQHPLEEPLGPSRLCFAFRFCKECWWKPMKWEGSEPTVWSWKRADFDNHFQIIAIQRDVPDTVFFFYCCCRTRCNLSSSSLHGDCFQWHFVGRIQSIQRVYDTRLAKCWRWRESRMALKHLGGHMRTSKNSSELWTGAIKIISL